MDKTRLSAMLARRGYAVHHDNSALQVAHLTGWLIVPYISIPARSYAQWRASIDDELGAGQHHVACATCATPLLQDVQGAVTQYHVYRTVQGGPLSDTIERCPTCDAPLMRVDSVREIVDTEGGEEEWCKQQPYRTSR